MEFNNRLDQLFDAGEGSEEDDVEDDGTSYDWRTDPAPAEVQGLGLGLEPEAPAASSPGELTPEEMSLGGEDAVELDDDAMLGMSDDPEVREAERIARQANMFEGGAVGYDDSWSPVEDLGQPSERLDELRKRAASMTKEERRSESRLVAERMARLAAQQELCGLSEPTDERDDVDETMRQYTEDLVELVEEVLELGEEGVSQRLCGAPWQLLYTTSQSVRFNQGTTGLARVLPTAGFSRVRQSFSTDGVVRDVRLTEDLDTLTGELTATMEGDFQVQKSLSFMTREEGMILRMFPRVVRYGFVTQDVNNWKSLESLDRLEFVYLDDDYCVMRNQGALKVMFIWGRDQA